MTFTDDMAELSGFGGGYEATCRLMMFAAIGWLAENGITLARGEPIPQEHRDGMEAAANAAGPGCSGAMMGAAISHAAWINVRGWDAYVDESRRRKAQDEAEAPARELENKRRREESDKRAADALAEQEAWVAKCAEDWRAKELAPAVRWQHIRYDHEGWSPSLGSDISSAAAEFLRLARGFGGIVPFVFNDCVLHASPKDESADAVVARYSCGRDS